MTGIIQNKGQKMLAINGMPDHLHIFFNMRPECQLSNLVMELKKSSNKFVSSRRLTNGKFHWQEGYGAFTYSRSDIDRVVKYILNQKEQHKKMTFKDEYIGFLDKFGLDYREEYLFDWISL